MTQLFKKKKEVMIHKVKYLDSKYSGAEVESGIMYKYIV